MYTKAPISLVFCLRLLAPWAVGAAALSGCGDDPPAAITGELDVAADVADTVVGADSDGVDSPDTAAPDAAVDTDAAVGTDAALEIDTAAGTDAAEGTDADQPDAPATDVAATDADGGGSDSDSQGQDSGDADTAPDADDAAAEDTALPEDTAPGTDASADGDAAVADDAVLPDDAPDSVDAATGDDASAQDGGGSEPDVPDPCAGVNCDDGNACTGDTCLGGMCGNVPLEAACSDGDACTVNDACSNGACSPGAAVACDDGNVCTDDSCAPASGCVHAANSAACEDGSACTSGDVCAAGACQGGAAANCDDDNPCTTDACAATAGCSHVDADGGACDDGQVCSTGDTCSHGACLGSVANCADSNPCTDDTCADGQGCVHLPNTVTCEDGSACTIADACQDAACAPGGPANCDDGDPCTTDSCDATSGCGHSPTATAPCDDGSACTISDICSGGACKGTAVNCDDANPCTDDACAADTGCSHTPAPGTCSDGNACTTGDGCKDGACVAVTSLDCDDGNPCTTDSCAAATGCTFSANTAPCDDDSACTLIDICASGTCAGTGAPDCNDSNPCTTDGCDAATGCSHTNADGLACDDGQVCSVNDTCAGGACLGSGASCADANPCTDDNCADGVGCVHINNLSPCDDGDACTSGDACAAGQCAGATADCDDGNACTGDSCANPGGCAHTDLTTPCSDGVACTHDDACSGGACLGTVVATDCDDKNACTTDTCGATGCSYSITADGAACDDGDACSSSDTCAAGACQSGVKVNCDDGNACTDDSCDALGACTHVANDAPCTDGNACTNGDVCAAKACVAGSKSCGKIAIIGDMGADTTNEGAVATMVAGWAPDYVLTTGDNNYLASTVANSYDLAVGKYYAAFLNPYSGAYGPGAADFNRFLPVIGNHDWDILNGVPYFDYFFLPGNERYFDAVVLGLHLYFLDSDTREPDGTSATSVQAQWLQTQLAGCTQAHCMVLFHHPAYTSSTTGATTAMRWPYPEWGATMAWMGHAHVYERIEMNGFPYVTQGIGGASLHGFSATQTGSQARYVAAYGASLLEVTGDWVKHTALNTASIVLDQSVLPSRNMPAVDTGASTTLVAAGSTWKYRDDGVFPGATWRDSSFDDSAWASGPAQLGYGDGDEATTVGYGGNVNAKYVTTWFRHSFNVTDPAVFGSLDVNLLRDDGAVVYLNGLEIWRSNMPNGTIGAGTLASISMGGAAETTWLLKNLPVTALKAGINVLSVEIHQQAQTSSDISFDLSLVAKPLTATKLVAFGATWKYRDTGVDPGAAFAQTAYDDSTWAQGTAPVGYGGIGEATAIGYGGNAANKFITSWARHTFTVSNATPPKALLLRYRRDDGFILRLNGQEIVRGDLPLTGVTAATLAGFAINNGAEGDILTTWVDPALLQAGTNVLSVEVHQVAVNSPDLLWDAELLAY